MVPRPLHLLLLFLVTGCTRDNPEFVGAGDGPIQPADGGRRDRGLDRGHVDRGGPLDLGPDRQINPNKPNGVDVLLVVDNSGGMGYPQQWLARDISTLVNGLDKLPGGPNYRLGVTTTDMGVGMYSNAGCTAAGDGAELLIPSSCPKPQGNVRYVQRIGTSTNVQGSVSQAVSCMVKQGTGGCGFEQALKAMKTALTSANKGFLRSDAALAVVLLTNEDDCSAASNTLFNPNDAALGPYASYRCFQHGVLCSGAKPPLKQTLLSGCMPGQQWLHDIQSEYVNFLNSLKPSGWLSLLVIAAPAADPVTVLQLSSQYPPTYEVKESCSAGSLDGYPSFRLEDLVNRFGSLAGFASICDSSYNPGLQSLLLRIQSAF